MNTKTVILMLLSLAPLADAGTYYGGFEDTTVPAADWDYNDLVFSVSGVTLNSSGLWFSEPVLNGALYASYGTPFWNNGSLDGSNDNIGFCIYGGGCNGTPASDPGAFYLATATHTNPEDVTFTNTSSVTGIVITSITADADTLDWECLTPAGCGSGTVLDGIYTVYSGGPTYVPLNKSYVLPVTLGATFALVGVVNGGAEYSSAGSNQFAFFGPGNISPEPATWMMLMGGIVMIGIGGRRKLR